MLSNPYMLYWEILVTQPDDKSQTTSTLAFLNYAGETVKINLVN